MSGPHQVEATPSESYSREGDIRESDVTVGVDAYIQGMKGDRVEIVVDAGGDLRTYEIVATRNGRRVETTIGRGVVEVTEVTRGGTAVRSARFMSSRVVALVEHPVTRPPLADDNRE